MEYKRLHRFKGIDVAEESTDASEQTLRYAENVVLRPRGAVSRMPPFRRLWGLQALQNYADQLEINPATDKTCLLSIRQPQGTNNTTAVFLVAHDFKNQKGLGLFCAVDLAASNRDISLASFTEFLPENAAPPLITTTIQVLKKGLAENQRWFFYRFYDSIVLGNGVDENLIYQHARETLRLRTMGSNAQPGIPVVNNSSAVVTPTKQAELRLTFGTFPERTVFEFRAGSSFIGETGNFIQVAFDSAGSTLGSTRTGEGTAESPLVYTVTGTGSANGNRVLLYIKDDPLIAGVLSVDSGEWQAAVPDTPPTPLTGGVGAGAPTSFDLQADGEIATSFFDPGVNGQGFSTGLSLPTRVRTAGNKIINPGHNTSGVLARFPKIRVWYRQPRPNTAINLPANTWLLLGECDNAPDATFEAKLPTKLDDRSVYFDGTDIQRPPPCTMFELCEDKLFASGNPANPTRLWYSVPANKTELVPEGFNLDKNFVEMGARKEEGSGTQITHLKQMDQRLQVHTSRGITLIHGRTFVRTFARSDFGALNPAAATAWSHHISPYLGADGVLYEMANQQALKSGVASAASWNYIRSFADTAEMQRNPWRANVAGDLTNQLVWVWLPCKLDGATRLAGFLFDYETKGFAGPITWPGLISTTKLSAVDPRIVGQTEDGNLVFIDSSDINRDEFQPNELLTGNFLAVSPNKLIFQTQLMDFGIPHEQKGYLELMFGVARGSFAENIVITLETDEGRSKVFNFGQLRGERNKCAFMLSGYAVRIRFEVTLNANRPFVLRDLVLGYRRQKIR